jgi:hypothetical protein
LFQSQQNCRKLSDLLKNKSARTGPSPSARKIQWPAFVVTLLVAAVAIGLLAAQLSWADDGESQLSLANLDKRVPLLESVTNWTERDHYFGIPLSAMGRELDASLDPSARVFVSGMLGPTNLPKAGYYYFLKNYLFPREVEISLDGKSFSGSDGFYGVPCSSPDVLRSNGFDLLIDFNGNGQLIPLTPKGVPHSE